jgi:two-component system nitrogen regulation response regulator GlnG
MKPFDPQKVLMLAENALKAHADMRAVGEYKPTINSEDYKEGIVGSSSVMQDVFKVIGQLTASDVTVIVTGESCSGKELVARSIWKHSHRASKPFIAVNCAAIPDNLIESELFGHEKGSFTGATAQRIGRFEQCDRGTIFLDEIGDMTLATQTKILRVLQDGDIQRVGGTEIIKVDVRVIAATNKDLEKMVAEKTFREDLYYRLNVVRVRVPPLRERMGDLPEIVDFMLQKMEKTRKTRVRRVSPEAMSLLGRHRWPGNVRELENVIYRSAVVAQGDTILIKDLPPELRAAAEAAPAPVVAEGTATETAGIAAPVASRSAFVAPATSIEAGSSLATTGSPATGTTAAASSASAVVAPSRAAQLDEIFKLLIAEAPDDLLTRLEAEMIRRALAHTQDNHARAAELLGITRNTLKKRADEMGI